MMSFLDEYCGILKTHGENNYNSSWGIIFIIYFLYKNVKSSN
jgi:hypothetical protein